MNKKSFSWIPNFLTIFRVALIPVFIYLLVWNNQTARIWALVLFVMASGSDMLDGWIARKFHYESEFGKFLDPLADKFLVISTLLAFLFLDPLVPLWMVILIFARDLLITVIRYLAIHKGESIRTTRLGKFKTAFQMLSIFIIIIVLIERANGFKPSEAVTIDSYLKIESIKNVLMSSLTGKEKCLILCPYLLMLMVTILTVISGIRYIYSNWNVLKPPYRKITTLADLDKEKKIKEKDVLEKKTLNEEKE